MQPSSSGGIRRRVRRLVTAAAAVGLAATMTGTASAAEATGPAAPGPVSHGTAASWPGELTALSGLTRAGTSSVAALPLNAIDAKGNWCAWNPSTKTGGGFGSGTCVSGYDWVNAAIGLTLDADKTEDAFVRSSATGHLYGLVSGQSKAVDQGPGWNGYTAITSVGNIGGTAADDVLARDHSGVLWVHPGYWNGHLAKRVRISAGWNAYTAIFGKYDYNGDHRTDVLAVDRNGYLWLHPGTGSISKPFGQRVRIATGKGYGYLFSTGDVNRDGRSDFLARDKTGGLFLFRGTGNVKTPFAARYYMGAALKDYKLLF
jgi:hypothetical protein